MKCVADITENEARQLSSQAFDINGIIGFVKDSIVLEMPLFLERLPRLCFHRL